MEHGSTLWNINKPLETVMHTREAVNSEFAKHLDTQGLRDSFLITDLFQPGKLSMTYCHTDRMIAGSVCPLDTPIQLPATKELGTDFFLARREMGIINIGGAGIVSADGQEFELDNQDALYLGMGTRDINFMSKSPDAPAKFYFNSCPAHRACKTRCVTRAEAKHVEMGSPAECNKRVIHQYIHPAVLESCQLVMGLTSFYEGSVWNTMPVHTHERRMEVYLYFDLPKDGIVIHLMGKPEETRHLIVRNEEAVISPSWSIHSGVGTGKYTFIWGMAGENQTFTDMDAVPMAALK